LLIGRSVLGSQKPDKVSTSGSETKESMPMMVGDTVHLKVCSPDDDDDVEFQDTLVG